MVDLDVGEEVTTNVDLERCLLFTSFNQMVRAQSVLVSLLVSLSRSHPLF